MKKVIPVLVFAIAMLQVVANTDRENAEDNAVDLVTAPQDRTRETPTTESVAQGRIYRV